jgi:hypothetical protein
MPRYKTFGAIITNSEKALGDKIKALRGVPGVKNPMGVSKM